MIKTRLVGLLSHAKKVHCLYHPVAVGGIALTGAGGIYDCRSFGVRGLSCGDRAGDRADDPDPRLGGGHTICMRTDGGKVFVSCMCRRQENFKRKDL